MDYKIVKLSAFSGGEASIYTAIPMEGDVQKPNSLYDSFIKENKSLYLSELKDIHSRLITMGKKTGVRDSFLKLKEGVPGDGVCALYDNPDSNLRLYGIKYGKSLLIIGGGGFKAKNTKALQETPKLEEENDILRWISKEIRRKMTEDEMGFSDDYMDFEGDLILKVEEDE